MAELVLYNKMKAAIEKCQSIDEIKEIRDKAEALRQYSKIAGDSEAMNKCAAIKIRAERRAGEMLKDIEKNKGGRPSENRSHDATSLSDLGLTKSDSSRWQRLANIPENRFDDFIEMVLERTKELTSAEALRFAASIRRDNERSEAIKNGKGKKIEAATFFVCDFDRADIKDASIDVIITDPPYPREFIPEYGKLSTFSARVLKPNSSLIVMVGESYFQKSFQNLARRCPTTGVAPTLRQDRRQTFVRSRFSVDGNHCCGTRTESPR